MILKNAIIFRSIQRATRTTRSMSHTLNAVNHRAAGVDCRIDNLYGQVCIRNISQ